MYVVTVALENVATIPRLLNDKYLLKIPHIKAILSAKHWLISVSTGILTNLKIYTLPDYSTLQVVSGNENLKLSELLFIL